MNACKHGIDQLYVPDKPFVSHFGWYQAGPGRNLVHCEEKEST